MGGNHCITDYYSKMPASIDKRFTSSYALPAASGAGKDSKHYEPSGGPYPNTLSVANGKVFNGNNIAIYVKGNLYLDKDIKFENTSWGSLEEMPSVYFIVKGNIYIHKSVQQLDGVFIAQKDGTNNNTGHIYTCTDGVTPYGANTALSNCRTQLVVNGGFVADKVHLMRSFGSLRNSYAGERFKDGTSQNCTDSGNTSRGDCAAEIFNFSPEFHLQHPDMPPDSGPTTGKYDYITSLSPVL
jgi:hypothetical protein